MSTPSTPGHTAEFAVIGMTCEHCVMSVTEEIQAIDAITNVTVDLRSGVVTIVSDQPVSAAAVRAAVEEAGYQVR
jgi:copper chaperone